MQWNKIVMQRFEFKVIPAPRRGEKARDAKTSEDRFALALTTLMNKMGAEGWDYLRADTLPVDERSGLTGTKTTLQNLLVFRRPLGEGMDMPLVAPLVATVPRLGPATEAPLGPAPAVKLDK